MTTYNPAELRVQLLLALPDVAVSSPSGYDPTALAAFVLERAADAYQAGKEAAEFDGAYAANQAAVDLAAAAGTVGTAAEVAIYLESLVAALKSNLTPNDQWSLGRSVAVERDRLLAHCSGIVAEFPALRQISPRLAESGLALP